MTGKRVSRYAFSQASLQDLRRDSHYLNWPVIYILEGRRQAYVGETTSAIRRIGTHLNDEHRKVFRRLYLIKDDTFNKSATLDLESSLIEYISGDGTYTLQNNNRGLRDHNYYDREHYWHLFEEIWEELRTHRIVTNSIRDIRNSDLSSICYPTSGQPA